jgi:uncharacterized protein Yka (UPF0111/DUF47 family)
MLREQAEVTVAGMAAFVEWTDGDLARESEVRDAEHAADEARRTLIAAVREAFTTPLPPEDLFEISHGLDEVINGAKNAVREAALMGLLPNDRMAEMAGHLEQGVRELAVAFAALGEDADAATTAADAAIKSQRHLERVYRVAMSELVEERELRALLARQELYRRLTRMSESVVAVAERVWYSTVKEA